jgi:hypothetical protein|tara:strand:- start:514 stop:846 length:333 start_codon:yes stop_codon:yes gene_type:complete
MENFKQDDDFQTEWESNFDSARDNCLTEVDNILMEVEHLVDDINQTVNVQDVLTLADAINKVVNLRYYSFYAQVYGKHQDYEETFDYDFTAQITQVLQDELSFELKLGAK